MKHSKKAYYILLFSFIWVSCDNDKIGPAIEITSPIENIILKKGDEYKLEAVISDDKELDYVEIMITGPDQNKSNTTIELEGTSQSITQDLDLDYTVSGPIEINLTAFDKAGNGITYVRTIQFNHFETGTIDLNIKLQYNGEPLVMFEPYSYPDGRAVDFTRCSFYTSEMQLDETTINEVEFHNLTNSHSTPELASQGYNWTINDVLPGDYNNLSFNIGVPEVQNNMAPGDFPSGHPLAKPAENWFSWQSYIFLKVEGDIDFDSDEDLETKVALHTGSNEALRRIDLEYPIQVLKGETTEVNLVFDIYQLFNGTERIFPIEENPQIHSLDQLEAVKELSNNLTNSIHKL